MHKNGMIECSNCRAKLIARSPRSVSRAYDKHRSQVSSKYRALNVLLVVGDCILVGLQVMYIGLSSYSSVKCTFGIRVACFHFIACGASLSTILLMDIVLEP